MGIFNRNKPSAPKKVDAPKKEKAPKSAEKSADAPVINTSKAKIASVSATLISPRVSEKAALLASKGTYVFNVPIDANKLTVRKAVETIYQVKVAEVRTVRGEGKTVRRGRAEGRRNRWKKALVTLVKGQSLNLYEGV
jgi:large subunit ribosomal protein L23